MPYSTSRMPLSDDGTYPSPFNCDTTEAMSTVPLFAFGSTTETVLLLLPLLPSNQTAEPLLSVATFEPAGTWPFTCVQIMSSRSLFQSLLLAADALVSQMS